MAKQAPRGTGRKSAGTLKTLQARARRFQHRHPDVVKYTAITVAVLFVVMCGLTSYSYVRLSRMIDARLHGEHDRVLPRVFARPLEIRRGEGISEKELIDRLNDLGYSQRTQAEAVGEFSVVGGAVTMIPRAGPAAGKAVTVGFQRPGPARKPGRGQPSPSLSNRVETIAPEVSRVTLDAPMLTALVSASREKRRQVPLSAIPTRMVQAVLAIEDRRYYSHPGVDPIRMVGALFTNTFGNRPYLEGASTITQQLSRNFFLTEEMAAEQQTRQRSIRRKLLEQFMSVILSIKTNKDQVLELYLNDVYLGNRGSFAIHGVPEAARLYFGKDVSNLTLAEAATIAGIIQSPATLSPFNAPARAKERRNVVLAAMADAGFVSKEAADRAAKEPLTPVARALDAEAPSFVDYIGDTLAAQFPGLTQSDQPVDVYTTLDLHLQRLAQDAVTDGLEKVDQLLSRRKHKGVPQAALLAIDPRTGEILAMVGGRSYNQSQYNRAVNASRQPGSVFKPFVYLAAFERAAEDGRSDLTPASLVNDEPTTFDAGGTPWSPSNYENEYDGEITFRRALAMSRNAATVKVAEEAGYDRVANLWKKIGAGTAPKPFPSIALGVFEATPLQIATAYTIFPNMGTRRDLRALSKILRGGNNVAIAATQPKAITRPESAYLVTNMMRSVINEGTAAAVRASGFSLDAAGKTGTTNDLRDAWFVGFTPELLTVVWVGYDENQALGLSGAQAAVPIWTSFMTRALAGHGDLPFMAPTGVTFATIDRDTGLLATPGCLRTIEEAFATGTEPTQMCALHAYN